MRPNVLFEEQPRPSYQWVRLHSTQEKELLRNVHWYLGKGFNLVGGIQQDVYGIYVATMSKKH